MQNASGIVKHRGIMLVGLTPIDIIAAYWRGK